MTRRRPRTRKLPATVRPPRFYRAHPWATAFGVGLVLLAVLGRQHDDRRVSSGQGGDFDRYHNKVFKVVNVVDGDTIDIDIPEGKYETTRIRLWGVDTPEVAGSPRGAMYWGGQASTFAKDTLAGARIRIALVEHRTRGKYKRLLAYIHLVSSGEMFNEMLISKGHAYADTRFRHPHRKRFVALEADARAAGVGLWDAVSVDRMPAWRQRRERR